MLAFVGIDEATIVVGESEVRVDRPKCLSAVNMPVGQGSAMVATAAMLHGATLKLTGHGMLPVSQPPIAAPPRQSKLISP